MASTTAGFEAHRDLESTWRDLHTQSDDIREKIEGATSLLLGLVETAAKERAVASRLEEEVKGLAGLWTSLERLPSLVEDIRNVMHDVEDSLSALQMERRRMVHLKQCRAELEALVLKEKEDEERVMDRDRELKEAFAKKRGSVEHTSLKELSEGQVLPALPDGQGNEQQNKLDAALMGDE